MKRDISQEGRDVIRWFENKTTVASLVKGSFPNERELRVSTSKGSIKTRGQFKNISDKKLKEQIRQLTQSIKLRDQMQKR